MTKILPDLRRKAVRLVCGLGLLAAVGGAFAPTAFAAAGTNEVISSNPASGSTQQVPPKQIQLTFRTAVEGDLVAAAQEGDGVAAQMVDPLQDALLRA